jgi:F1F0 ATPase subunit 2
MIETDDVLFQLLAAACFGFGLGWLYFGGLWLTLNRATHSSKPGLLMMSSLLLRLALLGLGLYLLADGVWQRYLAAVLGLWLARKLCTSRFAPKGVSR